VQSSRNRVLRYLGVDIRPVNWGWLCDKGRFDFEAIHSDDRLGAPLVRDGDGESVSATWSEPWGGRRGAQRAKRTAGPRRIACIGGARLTNEDAYAWAKLAKGVIGTDNVDAQLGDGLPAEAVLGLPRATIDEACTPGGTVVLLGPDPKEELPVLYLRLRHAVVEDGVTLVEITPRPTGLGHHAAASLTPSRCTPPGWRAPARRRHRRPSAASSPPRWPPRLPKRFGRWSVTVVLGRGSLAELPTVTVDAAAALHAALPGVASSRAAPRQRVRCARHGPRPRPAARPGRPRRGARVVRRVGGTVPAERGLDTAGILPAAADGTSTCWSCSAPTRSPTSPTPTSPHGRWLAGARTVVALDRFVTESVAKADVVLPAAGFAECDGTTTNLEGRVSRSPRRSRPPGTARTDWMIAAELAWRLGADLGVASPGRRSAEGVHVPLSRDIEPADAIESAPDGRPDHRRRRRRVRSPEGRRRRAADGTRSPGSRRAGRGPVDAYSLRLVASRKMYDQGTMVPTRRTWQGSRAGQLRLNRYDFDRLGIATGASVRVTRAPAGSVDVAVVPRRVSPGESL
jgi:NADH-quinone oxidoreductase subunit G